MTTLRACASDATPHISRNNAKLGRALAIPRPVGDTCPISCPFRPDNREDGAGPIPRVCRCYAEAQEQRFRHIRDKAEANLHLRVQQWREIWQEARRTGRPVRIHDRGDFMREGRIDTYYLAALRLSRRGFEDVPAWLYTHVYDRRIAALADAGIAVYASVHTRYDFRKAHAAGFTRLAWVIPMRKQGTCKPQLRGLPTFDAAAYNVPGGSSVPVCPQQRGAADLTCAACRLCVDGRSDVAFLLH